MGCIRTTRSIAVTVFDSTVTILMAIRKKAAPIVTLEMLSGGSNSISLIFITLIKRYLDLKGMEKHNLHM